MPNTITDTITELADNKSDIQDALVAKGVTSAGKHGFGKFAEDIASIANQYTLSDEGKVVSSGELVAQIAYPSEITANNTYDTTNYNSVTVNVSGGTSSSVTAQLYSDSAFTTTAKGYITVFNQSTIIVSGVLKYGSTAVSYYINPTELQLSDYLSSDKTMTLQKTSSTSSIETATGTLSVSNNLISIKFTSSGSGTATTALFGTKSIT